ncbi:MAG: heat-inducible transcriptional repressor HrcA [Rhodospirillaceae bacterium]|jgi:heat-inducible transcriptional repressor|nr:heat-inducible transcriptional repressor HrcA [Rhodospirillaceae bacterium]MBT5666375.1 heat-inducible transcriptional repressor HrcA [Rhodospirillaceae bacterium]MBT5812127.1 heat-inducible transcriptional repressor HrcA [Rhodospirillaceae bacterium]
MFPELNQRSRDILKLIVEAYVETGEPVGSRLLSRQLGAALSPATIRNAMADMEDSGLLYSPHTSAGRLPTDAGLRLFVDGILEIGNLTEQERENIEAQSAASGRTMPELLEEATMLLSGLSRCAGLVVAPKQETALKHVEFVALGSGQALVVLVAENGMVENRIVDLPLGLPPSSLVKASNFLSAHLVGKTLQEVEDTVRAEMGRQRAELDALTQAVVKAGVAIWSEGRSGDGVLIVRGQSHLLDDVTGIADLERIRALFEALEEKETVLRVIEKTGGAEGVQIFIGAENDLFAQSGCSVIIAPFANRDERIVGAIGVVGPTRMNYGRIIPMVDYTAKIVGGLVG